MCVLATIGNYWVYATNVFDNLYAVWTSCLCLCMDSWDRFEIQHDSHLYIFLEALRSLTTSFCNYCIFRRCVTYNEGQGARARDLSRVGHWLENQSTQLTRSVNGISKYTLFAGIFRFFGWRYVALVAVLCSSALQTRSRCLFMDSFDKFAIQYENEVVRAATN